MKFNPLAKTGIPLLKKSLDAYAARHKAIAENIANVDTKGYRPLKVNFEESLKRLLEKKRVKGLRSDPRHMQIGEPVLEIKETVSTSGERVNLEEEMAALAQNQLLFQFAAKQLHGSYETLRSAIVGRIR
ncbi:MAG: flagellar basal body rod protein FlgB [Calditrichaeota bacterium]|nr:MAG: flagellar basal body rod protein FlgB [Calditrichota bacterium]